MNEIAHLLKGGSANPAPTGHSGGAGGLPYSKIKAQDIAETLAKGNLDPSIDLQNIKVSGDRTRPAFADNRMEEVAHDFQKLIFSYMLKQMPFGLHKNPIIGGGYAEEIWHSYMVDEYGKLMASKDHKLKEQIQRSLISIQESQQRNAKKTTNTYTNVDQS